MNAPRIAYIVASAATAVSALIAAAYWYLSSRPTPQLNNPPDASISDVPEIHILSAQVDIYAIEEALSEASRLNKKAALWSAAAALLAAVAAVLGIL